MRTRSTVTGSFTNVQRFRRNRSCGGSYGAPSVIANISSGSVKTKTITDVNIPGFQALKKCKPKRVLPFNPMTVSTVSETRTPGSTVITNRPTSCPTVTREDYGAEWIIPAFSLVDPGVSDAVISSVVNAAAADARSAVFDALTFIAESREIGPLFSTQVRRITGITRKLRTQAKKIYSSQYRNFLKQRKSPDKKYNGKSVDQIFNKLWLEYRYAWMPLILSVADFTSAMSEGGKHGQVRGRGSQTISNTLTKTYTSLVDSGRATLTVNEVLEYTHVVRGWALADFSSQQSQLGFDPLATAYELTRFSFVFDWFVQIGTWITAVSPFQPGGLISSGYSIRSTVKRRIYTSIAYSGTVIAGSITSGAGPTGELLVETQSYTRQARSPSFPGWNPRLTPKRTVDAWALLNVLLRTGRS